MEVYIRCFTLNIEVPVSTNKQNPWTRVLLGKLTVPQLVKKVSTLYETQTVITTFT